MIKKLFTLLLVAATGVNAWGQNKYDFSTDGTGHVITVYVDSKTGCQLGTGNSEFRGFVNSYYHTYNGSIYRDFNKAVLPSELTADDAAKLYTLPDYIITLDLSACTAINPSTVNVNSKVKYVVLPNGWTKAQVNEFAANNSGNGNALEAVASLNGGVTTTAWQYTNRFNNTTYTTTDVTIKTVDGVTYCIPYISYSVTGTLDDDRSGWQKTNSDPVELYEGTHYTYNDDVYGSFSPIKLYTYGSGIDNKNNQYTMNGNLYTRYVATVDNIAYGTYGDFFQLGNIYGPNGYDKYVKDNKTYFAISDQNTIYTNNGNRYIAEGTMNQVSIYEKYVLVNAKWYGNVQNMEIEKNNFKSLTNNGDGTYTVETNWNGNIVCESCTYVHNYTYNNNTYTDFDNLYYANNKYYLKSETTKLYELVHESSSDWIYYNNATKEKYDGTIFYDPYSTSTPYGTDGSLVKLAKAYFTSQSSSDLYTGKVYISESDKKAYGEDLENPFFLISQQYVYTYEDFQGRNREAIYSSALSDKLIALSGDELYIPCVQVSTTNSDELALTAYVVKPGSLAKVLQHMSQLGSKYITDKPESYWYIGSDGSGYSYSAYNITSITISGLIYAVDINNGGTVLNSEGHYVASNATSANGALDSNNNSRIKYADFSDARFGDDNDETYKYYPEDMTLVSLGFANVETLELPTHSSQTIIPQNFMSGSAKIEKLKIPCNYHRIEQRAFYGTSIHHFTTTAANDTEQYGVERGGEIDNGDLTVTFASTIQYIGTGAFVQWKSGEYLITDVYCLASQAPECELNAFSAVAYCGEDKYDPTHSIRRGSYICSSVGMAMLHFPDGISMDEKRHYTDVTRQYQQYDETGGHDNNGNLYLWPTQEQYIRSYNQAVAGVTWNAWIPYSFDRINEQITWNGGGKCNGIHKTEYDYVDGFNKPKSDAKEVYFTDDAHSGTFYDYILSFLNNTDKNSPTTTFKSYVTWNGGVTTYDFQPAESGWSQDWKIANYGIASADWSEAWESSLLKENSLTYDWTKYGGWHQFVLAEYYNFEDTPTNPDPTDKPEYADFTKYNKDVWYSICFPFNMTKAQVLQAFGRPANTITGETEAYPYIATLTGVTRNPDLQKISIHLSKNLVDSKVNIDSKNCVVLNDDETKTVNYVYEDETDLPAETIIIEADKPYYIHPYLPASVKNNPTEKRKYVVTPAVLNNPKDVHFPTPVIVHARNASGEFVDGSDQEIDESDVDSYAYNYYFVGNYRPNTKIPVNAYFLKWINSEVGTALCHNNSSESNWTTNAAIIMGISANYGSLKKVDKTSYYEWKASAADDYTFYKDCFDEISGAKGLSVSWFGEEDEETANIMLPNADDSYVSFSANSKVYNISGQFVGVYSDKLPKGLYIVEGKKIVIK